jgi:hypothetical protein
MARTLAGHGSKRPDRIENGPERPASGPSTVHDACGTSLLSDASTRSSLTNRPSPQRPPWCDASSKRCGRGTLVEDISWGEPVLQKLEIHATTCAPTCVLFFGHILVRPSLMWKAVDVLTITADRQQQVQRQAAEQRGPHTTPHPCAMHSTVRL